MTLRARQREAAVELILEAAARVFAERGYQGSSMEDVARACDCAPATLYGYFKGKRDLFAQMLQQHIADYFEGLGAALAIDGDFDARFASYTRFFREFSESNHNIAKSLLQVLRSQRDASVVPDPAAIDAVRASYRASIAQLMKQGVDEGALQDLDPYRLADSLIGLLHTHAFSWLIEDDAGPLADIVGHLEAVFLGGVRRRESPEAPR